VIADVLLASAASVAVLMIVMWIVSVLVKDASIVDIVWGLGFVVVAATALAVGEGWDVRRQLLLVLVAVWGLRLSGYLAWRNLGHGEDYRYQAMRKKWGDRFWLVSLVQVFLLQGVLMLVVSLPVQLAATAASPTTFGPLAYLGVAVWFIGLLFETLGDAQLAQFKANPDNQGQVMDQGLWRYTRHPNYFGDAVQWWGVFLTCLARPLGAFGILGPMLMTFLQVRVSGVALLERSLQRRKPDYASYVARTSAFVPRRPRPAP
jgi:steroid 5-alpha reductase family enzyme